LILEKYVPNQLLLLQALSVWLPSQIAFKEGLE